MWIVWNRRKIILRWIWWWGIFWAWIWDLRVFWNWWMLHRLGHAIFRIFWWWSRMIVFLWNISLGKRGDIPVENRDEMYLFSIVVKVFSAFTSGWALGFSFAVFSVFWRGFSIVLCIWSWDAGPTSRFFLSVPIIVLSLASFPSIWITFRIFPYFFLFFLPSKIISTRR